VRNSWAVRRRKEVYALVIRSCDFENNIYLRLFYSTLLDLIAGRKTDGIWSGHLAFNGDPIQPAAPSNNIAYVYQSDLLMSTLTVEETIRYATWLNLGSNVSESYKEERVNAIISQLALTRVRDSRVFDDVKHCGLSGGERKRLSIATQIVGDPKFILLDEPTSGLDSALAYEVMSTVRAFCTKERMVLTTIHQPSRAVFACFDKLLVLVQGRVMFFGPASEAVNHFTSPAVGFMFAGGFANPAEFVLDVCRAQLLPQGSSIRLQAADLSALYEGSRYHMSVVSAIKAETTRVAVAESHKAADDNSESSASAVSSRALTLLGLARGNNNPAPQFARSYLAQCLVLIHRTWTWKARDMPDLRGQVVKNISGGLLYGLIFFQRGDPSGPYYENGYTKGNQQSVNSLLAQTAVYAAFTSLSAVGYLTASKSLYRRESGSGSYSSFAYAVSQAVSLMPIQLFVTSVLVVVLYFLSGLPVTGEYFFFFLLSSFMGVYFSFTLTMAVAACCADPHFVYLIVAVQADIMISLIGFSPKVDDMTPFYRFFANINYMRWQFEAQMINHWMRYDTDDEGASEWDGNGNVLEDFSFDHFSRFYCLWILVLMTALVLLFFYWSVLPASSRLHKVTNAEDARAVLQKEAITRSQASSVLDGFLPASSDAASLQEKLIVPDAADLIVEETTITADAKPRLSVASFAASNEAGDLSEGCSLVFRNVCAPAREAADEEGDWSGTADNHQSSDNLSTLSDRVGLANTPASTAQSSPAAMFVRGVSGVVYPGEMLAIMGSSGAGKTTLLSIISQRKKAEDYSGKIYYNGVLGKMPPFGFVTQEDLHVGVMTVREALEFAGELRLPQGMPKDEKKRRVDRILSLLLLQHVADSLVGGEHAHNISGGEVRRLSIGVELLHFPGLMFLDEPTTGLDSSTSLELLSALRNLANQNRTVVMTIHQPSEGMFVLFDRVMIMAQAHVVYFGGVSNCTDFYTQSPYEFPFPSATMDPAEYMIAAAGGFIPAADGRSVSAGELAAYYASSPQCVAVRQIIVALEKSYSTAATANAAGAPGGPAADSSVGFSAPTKPHLSFGYQLKVLLGRRFLVLSRKRSYYFWKAVK
jgi:ABC-type multidrug transport system ATPase subunit